MQAWDRPPKLDVEEEGFPWVPLVLATLFVVPLTVYLSIKVSTWLV